MEVEIKIRDLLTGSITIDFTLSSQNPGSQWGISSFLLLTGNCHPSCQVCEFSVSNTECSVCRSFFIRGTDGICSRCAPGFRLNNASNTCDKCPIEYSDCQVGQ